MPKLLALDLDGTTFSKGTAICAQNRTALRRAREAGHIVCFITGRRILAPLEPIYELGDYLVLNNGGTVHRLPDLTQLVCRMADQKEMLRLIDFCNENRLTLHLISQTYWGMNQPNPRVGEAEHNWPYEVQLFHSAQELPFDTLDGFMVTGPRCREALEFVEREGLALNCVQSEPELVDIMPAGVNKWTGTQYVAALHGIPREDVIGAGNYYNDLDLILGAGVGVAVQNSPEEIKPKADYVTLRTNEEGAVAEIIDRFVFDGG